MVGAGVMSGGRATGSFRRGEMVVRLAESFVGATTRKGKVGGMVVSAGVMSGD